MREKLMQLIKYAERKMTYEEMIDYLIANGVVVLMRDGNDFNPDVYCPYCGNNLTSAWEVEQ